MKETKIIKKLKGAEISIAQALEELAKIGLCPNVLNDDNGHWAVKFDGYQNVVYGDKPEDVTTTFFVEAKEWKNNIYEALIWALEN